MNSGKACLIAVGDVMLGDHPVCYGHGIRSALRKHGMRYLLGQVSNLLGRGDIVFCNLEGVLSREGDNESILKCSELRGDPESAKSLAEHGFNLVNVANNHMLQHGREAFLDTLAHLDRAGIEYCGLCDEGESNVLRKFVNGVELVFLGYSLRPERYCSDNDLYAHGEKELVLKKVKTLKTEFPEAHIVLSLHWGEEYLSYPSGDQIDFAHALIDEGCSLILGHHPHVLQGVERYKSGLIAYSLGNFVFDKWQRSARESVILECTFDAAGLLSFVVHPVLIQKNYRVINPCERDRKIIESRLSGYSESITSRDRNIVNAISEYKMLADKAYFRFRMQSYFYFFTHIWKYRPAIVWGSFARFVKRRLGLA